MTTRARLVALTVSLAALSVSACAVVGPPQTPAGAIDDRVITAAIQSRYVETQAALMSDISVETLYGVVLLTGSAASEADKVTAGRIAAQVEGVKAVRNEILIETQP